jgi:hypothetical protein
MKKSSLVAIMALACLGLEAAQYKHKISVSPMDWQTDEEEKQYIAKVEIEKIAEDDSSPQLIASPVVSFIEGKPAKVQVEGLQVDILVPKNSATAQVSIVLVEDAKIVMSAAETVKIQ